MLKSSLNQLTKLSQTFPSLMDAVREKTATTVSEMPQAIKSVAPQKNSIKKPSMPKSKNATKPKPPKQIGQFAYFMGVLGVSAFAGANYSKINDLDDAEIDITNKQIP